MYFGVMFVLGVRAGKKLEIIYVGFNEEEEKIKHSEPGLRPILCLVRVTFLFTVIFHFIIYWMQLAGSSSLDTPSCHSDSWSSLELSDTHALLLGPYPSLYGVSKDHYASKREIPGSMVMHNLLGDRVISFHVLA